MKKLFLSLVVLIAFTAMSFGQDTKSANVAAAVVAPITLAKTVDMNFGSFLPAVTSTKTVVLATDGTRSASTATLVGNTSAAAEFTVSGEVGNGRSITLPADGTVTLAGPSGSTAIPVNSFVSTPSGIVPMTDGTGTILVGATLTVGVGQAVGSYTGSFAVTVNND